MAKDNPWFKFEPAEWQFGRISKQSKEVRSDFLDIINEYWHNKCVLTLEDVQLDYGKEVIDRLLETKILKLKDDHIQIKFLDLQMIGIRDISAKNSIKGIKSAEFRSKGKEKSKLVPEEELAFRMSQFEQWWPAYDKNRGKDRCLDYFIGKLPIRTGKRITDEERLAIMKNTPLYIKSTPVKQKRKDPGTYLYNSAWKDEVLSDKKEPTTVMPGILKHE